MNKRQLKKRKKLFPAYPWLRTRSGLKILSIHETKNPSIAEVFPITAFIEYRDNHAFFTRTGRYIGDSMKHDLDLMRK